MSDVDDFNAQVIADFRANAGVVGGAFADHPLVLLTHTGAKTATVRTTPLNHVADGDRLVIFASCMGAPKHPQWFHNVVANPEVTVEVGRDRYRARARVLEGDERDMTWRRVVAARPFLADYQVNTGGRVIPLIALERGDG